MFSFLADSIGLIYDLSKELLATVELTTSGKKLR